MTTITVPRKLIEQAVGLMEDSLETERDAYFADWRHHSPARKAGLERLKTAIDAHAETVAALRAALAQQAEQTPDRETWVNNSAGWQPTAAAPTPQAEQADARDAARYRWLREVFSPMGLNIDGNHAWAFRWNGMLKGPNLDAAIDAAMGEPT